MPTEKSPYSRFRSQNNTSSAPATYIRTGPGDTTTTDTWIGARLGVYRSMHDWVTPAYKEMSAQGLLINNPVSSLKATFSLVSASGWGHYNAADPSHVGEWKGLASYALGWWQGQLGLSPPAPLIATDRLHTIAITRAMANVNKPTVQGLAFIGELNQTLDLLRHPFGALTKFFRRPLKKRRSYSKVNGRWRWTTSWEIDSKAAIGAIASQYLAFQFGALPLMHDIEGIVQSLVFRHPEVLRQTARAKESEVTTSIQTGYATTGFLEAAMETTYQEEIEVRTGILYAFKGESSMASLGLRLSDVPAAAWELLPWSFVIDWVSNVGDVVAGLTALCTSDLLTQWTTVNRKLTVTRRILSSRTSAPWVQLVNCTDSDRCVYETRTRSPETPGSGMGLALNLSLNRIPVLSAISLLIQQLTKGRR